MFSRSSLLLVVFFFAAGALAQQCQPSQGILKLVGMDPGCAAGSSAVQECVSKLQLSVSQMCMVQLQPDLPVAADGTFCSPSQGAQQRDTGVIGAKLVMGRSDIDAIMRPHAASGSVMVNLKGRFVPPAGGREFPLDCNMVFNVTGGSALGIVSTGSDSLMSTTVAGGGAFNPAVAGGGYSGASLPGQQTSMNGGMMNGMLSGPESGKSPQQQQQQPSAQKSSAGWAAGSTAAKVVAGLVGLLLPAVL